MGKIMVVGVGEREYEANICDISLKVETNRDTAAEASRACTEQCEKLLNELSKIGIDPSEIEISYDSISQRGYGSDPRSYESTRKLWIHAGVDMKLVNTIRAIIEDGFEDVSLSTVYSISDKVARRKELLEEAVADSRKKAEMLALSMGQKVIGVDTANLSGDEDVYDLTKDDDDEPEVYYMRVPSKSMSDKLKPEKVSMSAAVKIVWLVE